MARSPVTIGHFHHFAVAACGYERRELWAPQDFDHFHGKGQVRLGRAPRSHLATSAPGECILKGRCSPPCLWCCGSGSDGRCGARADSKPLHATLTAGKGAWPSLPVSVAAQSAQLQYLGGRRQSIPTLQRATPRCHLQRALSVTNTSGWKCSTSGRGKGLPTGAAEETAAGAMVARG